MESLITDHLETSSYQEDCQPKTKKRFRLSPKVNQKAFESMPEEFSTFDFSEASGSNNITAARKFLLRMAMNGKVNEFMPNMWSKVTTKSRAGTRALLEEDVKIITDAMDLIQKLIEENRWLKDQVEHWAGIARQAKLYHNGREGE